ncbi:potassium transporter Trk [Salinibacterium sp. SYSU T00001]|uniref:potassium transporter Trk n=1 Tax=Homoserinimonas sedimenticola TaxID=2986805 RepID=UPI002235BF80|nr:potassium transporter Trk [Salinibacterium sedimenticola]MCW4385516.1 potassium transporter Trk [Salinibacterium sedimenticola]
MSEQNETAPGSSARQVSIRRAPKVPVFLLLGALVGLLTALVLTAAFPVDPLVGFGATFGYLCIYFIPAGLVLGALVALILDAASKRRARDVTMERDTVQGEDELS